MLCVPKRSLGTSGKGCLRRRWVSHVMRLALLRTCQPGKADVLKPELQPRGRNRLSRALQFQPGCPDSLRLHFSFNRRRDFMQRFFSGVFVALVVSGIAGTVRADEAEVKAILD